MKIHDEFYSCVFDDKSLQRPPWPEIHGASFPQVGGPVMLDGRTSDTQFKLESSRSVTERPP
jgi:hypothetical protein